MSEDHPHHTPVSSPRRWWPLVLVAGVLVATGTTGVLALSRISSASKTGSAAPHAAASKSGVNTVSTPRLRTGRPIKALDFAIVANPARLTTGVTPETSSPSALSLPVGTPRSSTPVKADSPAAAVTSFVNAAIAGDLDTAWSLVGTADRVRLGYKQRIAEETNASGWKGFSVTSTIGDSVVGSVTQTPKVSDIDGVIAAQGNLRVQTIKEGATYRVLWSRKSIAQVYPELSVAQDDAVSAVVGSWSRSRQACDATPAHEFTGGLIGVVGLANKLCRTTGDPVLGAVSDLEALDEPQPIIEAFGGTALQWARVVSITAPVPMEVVVAPRGTEWIVVAVARPTISSLDAETVA